MMLRIATLAFALSVPMSARADDGVAAKLAAYMEAVVGAEHFQGAVLVAKGNDILLSKGYGQANAEHGVPNTPETKFRLGSITKQFTAVATLILRDRGKLAVDDPIGKYIDDAPKAWEKVTIHHLLTHTSGIPSYTGEPDFLKSSMNPETTASMIGRFRDKPLEFEPGSTFKYNNSGYFLLGAIIEKVSGKPYDAFLKEEIFDPLGMAETGYDRHAPLLPKRASGYDRKGSELRNAPYLDMSQPYAAGALYSTVGDLYAWDRALKAGKLLSEQSFKEMFTPFKGDYAYGWAVGDLDGRKIVGHGGGINGFATDIERFPDDDVCVVVLCNAIPSNPSKVARQLASIVFGVDVPLPTSRTRAKVDPNLYDGYVGSYVLSPAMTIKVTRDGDRLMTQGTGQGKFEVVPESETTFHPEDFEATITFVKEGDKVTHLILHQGGKEMRGDRAD